MVKKKKIQIIIWNDTIHKLFVALLVLVTILLSGLSYNQNLYIKELEYKIIQPEFEQVEPEIIALDEFQIEHNLTTVSIGELGEFFTNKDYEVYFGRGILQASKEICDKEFKCERITYRFNQRKGMYMDKYTLSK